MSVHEQSEAHTTTALERQMRGTKPYCFKPGQSGNPGGTNVSDRRALANAFFREMKAKFAEHGASVIDAVMRDKPDKFLELVASLVPQEATLNVNSTVDIGENATRLSSSLEWLRALTERRGQGLGSEMAGEERPLLAAPVCIEQTGR